jgi:hypothetical protein
MCIAKGMAGLALTLVGIASAAPQHDHATHAGYDDKQVPAPVTRWTADAPLRDGMGRIHTALEELRHYEMGHMSEAMAQDRAGLIEEAGADIFAHCKLQPHQDAVLHEMLVPLLAAAQKLKDHPQDMAEVAAMRVAVADYPHYFDDPAWSSDAAPVHAMHDGH